MRRQKIPKWMKRVKLDAPYAYYVNPKIIDPMLELKVEKLVNSPRVLMEKILNKPPPIEPWLELNSDPVESVVLWDEYLDCDDRDDPWLRVCCGMLELGRTYKPC